MDDLDHLVDVMVTAATSHLPRCVWDVLLGTDPATTRRVLTEVATSPGRHWCHVDAFLVAEVDSRPVGAASSFDPATEGNEALTGPVLDALAAGHVTPDALDEVVGRAGVLERGTPAATPGAWGIENVAVANGYRGLGVVEALFAVAFADAVQRDRDTVQILCLHGNERAERAWERNGFTRRAEAVDDDFEALFGCPGMRLLVRRP